MPRKANATVTRRFVDESRKAARKVASPFPDPPHGRTAIGRLCFRGPSPKLDYTTSDLVTTIGSSLPDAAFFLDTSIFTTQLDVAVWNALCTRRILITPGVWKELLPWLKTPFRNATIRDTVLTAARSQASRASEFQQSASPRIEVLFLDEEEFTRRGYKYYLDLLTLRKLLGPVATAVLTKRLERAPTQDEFVAEVQGKFGARALRMARKGIEAANSPNKLTDEQLVVAAVLTAIMRGSEVFIITRDADVLEQYFKLLCLMKEHYRAMLVADQYAANPELMKFRQVPVGGAGVPGFAGSSVFVLETTDAQFNPLPPKFHFVNIYCLLLGGSRQP